MRLVYKGHETKFLHWKVLIWENIGPVENKSSIRNPGELFLKIEKCLEKQISYASWMLSLEKKFAEIKKRFQYESSCQSLQNECFEWNQHK